MRSLFYFPLTLHFPLNLLLHFLMITTLSTITSNICFTNTAAASTTISYPGASPWLYRRELPNTNLDDDNDHNNNNNDDGYDDDDEHIKDKDIGNNPRRPPEITWLRIWRPLGDPPSSPRGHLLFLVEEDQNISYAAANWEDGAVPEVASRAIATEIVEFNGIEDFTIKLMSPSAGTATVRFRKGDKLGCFENPDRQPGMWICLYEKSMREQIRRLTSSED